MSAGLDDAEQQFGPYLVYERLGVGGMATVHRALERGVEGVERTVALKRLLPHLAEDATFIKAFVREAKLASLLDHLNIVHIFELGRVGTEYFISMEYIEGRDIRRILRHARKVTGPPPIEITAGILIQLCDALDYAHTRADEHGRPLLLVHRDVSPSNLIVSTTGVVKVIDFGIAKAQTQQHRTQTGRVKGKLAYLAPEAVSGRGELDARSDLFAVGVIAHELLTARPLFASKNEYDTLIKVQRAEILPPSSFNPACPPELDAIVTRALARDPDDRYRSAAALRTDLRALRERYALRTTAPDIAAWVDWAFAPENDDSDDAVIELVNVRTPAPRREDDDAVEIAWGSGEPERPGPILLDDVPDVSEKHLAPRFEDDDDIPTPVPTHGSRTREPATLAEPDEDYDAPLELAEDPDRAGRVSGQRAPQPSGRHRAASQLATPVMGQALIDALEEANLAAETLRGMQPADTLPTRAVPPSPDDPPEDELAAPPTYDDDHPTALAAASTLDDLPPMRPTPSVVTSAPRTDDPPTRKIALPRPETLTELDGEEPPTDQVVLLAAPSPGTSGAVVRFKRPTHAPPEPVPVSTSAPTMSTMPPTHSTPLALPMTPSSPVRTLPGHGTARPAKPTSAPLRPDSPIGAAIIERSRRGPNRRWIVLASVAGVAAVAAAVLFVVTRGDEQPEAAAPPASSSSSSSPASTTTPEPASTRATVKVITEPSDTEISIEGRVVHAGAPWTTELEPGTYQIQITRRGYKSWLTSLELSARDNHTLRVVLEKLPAANAAPTQATLILDSTPSGLEAELDGKLLPVRTPIRMPLSTGPHTIALRKDGAIVWRQDVDATAAVDYEFNPSFEAAKQRERAERKQPARATFTPPSTTPPPAPTPSPTPAPDAAPAIAPTSPDAAASQVQPPPAASTPAPPTPNPPSTPSTAPKLASPPAPPPRAPTRPAGPLTVPPTAVTKLSGAPVELARSKDELPASAAAKVCISYMGKVTSVDLITKLDPRSTSEIAATLKTWTYEPYMHQHVATPVCFALSLRLR